MERSTRIKLAYLFSLSISLMSGCASHHQAVQGAYATPEQTPILASAGTTGGVIAAAASSGLSVPAGAAAGGAAGFIAGHFADSPTAIAKRIAGQGAQVVAIGDNLQMIIFSDNCFEFGTSNLTHQCEDILDNVGALLKQYGNTPVKISAYTDNGFGESFAKSLSQQQADSVVAYLWAHGIPHQRFNAKGFGSANPIASTYTTQGNYMNRRVEINLG